MSLYSFALENKYILELLYALAITLICGIIVFRTDKFYRLSFHQGIRYFRNAFLFYGLGFMVRYIFGVLLDAGISYSDLLKPIFEYFFIMAGFFLLYSLIWRKFESSKEEYSSSLFNAKVAIFHVMALLLAVLDTLWQAYYFLFTSEIIIFFCASIIAYNNLRKDRKKHRFLNFYFIAMLLSLVGWILNFLAESYFNWDHNLLIGVGIIDIFFFILFLAGIIRITTNHGIKET